MTSPMQTAPLDGRHILVVEDDYLVAQALSGLLVEAGAVVVGPIGWLDEALIFVRDHHDRFDAAVLDVDLHGEKSYAIADALQHLEKRFVFTTGYGKDELDAGYQEIPRCEKPFDARVLLHALSDNSA